MRKAEIFALEASIERTIVEGLTALGYIVQTTGARAFTGRADGKGYGGSKGVPDLLVTKAEWPVGCLAGLEVKTSHKAKWSSPEQEAFWVAGRSFRVTSWEEALWALGVFERLCLNTRGQASRQWLASKSSPPAPGTVSYRDPSASNFGGER
ncbi:hypothetical protein EON81_09370 [bacterium]|nr:MAG: hypothetical protein EON81_09370 [bacterium]